VKRSRLTAVGISPLIITLPHRRVAAAAAAAAAAADLQAARRTVAEMTIIETNHFVLPAVRSHFVRKPSHP